MHEINAAAEAITSAADPEANIIFGATISHELEGEVIITVVATGFDASYFSARKGQDAGANDSITHDSGSTPLGTTDSHGSTDSDMSNIDMDLDDKDAESSDFQSDTIPNIWTLDSHDQEASHHEETPPSVTPVSSEMEEELEKPSFLRRLTRKHKDGQKPESTDKSD
jgi:hypothetical protein